MRPVAKKLLHHRLTEVLHYKKNTGEFVWKVSLSPYRTSGSVAGTVHKDGYRTISVDGEIFMAHRLAWFYVTGEWPIGQVDHLDAVRDHNAFSNLRDVPPYVNSQNVKKKRSDSVHSTKIGVGRATKILSGGARSKSFVARIVFAGNRLYLGSFSTEDEAYAAYLKAKRAMHEGNTL